MSGRQKMQHMNGQRALSRLRLAGWQETAIKQLVRFRQTYTHTELDQAQLDPRRLAFARWLVATGRLTEQLPALPQAADAPGAEQQSWRLRLLARLRGGILGLS